MFRYLCAKTAPVFIITALFSSTSPLFAVNGTAVSIAVRYSVDKSLVPESHWSYRGKLVRFDIVDNQVVDHDTLYHGLAEFPSLSMDGSRIAFFRDGDSVDGSTLVRSGYDWLSVIDIDGNNLRDLVQFGDGTVGYGNIVWNGVHDRSTDWPFGKWIYYVYPKTNEIWRINPDDTTEHELVMTFEYSSAESGYIRRWNLSADASKISIQWKKAEPGTNGAFPFPWDPDSIGLLSDNQRAFFYCNISMAPSGNYVTAYDGHCHCTFPVGAVDWETNTYSVVRQRKDAGLDDIAFATGRDSVGRGGEYIRWAANSDKWILQQIGWIGHDLGVTFCGSNQILWNWVDNEAIITTDNPPNAACTEDSTIAYSNSAGDFLVEGPLGCVEDTLGNWVPVDYGPELGTRKDFRHGNMPAPRSFSDMQRALLDDSKLPDAAMFDINGRRHGNADLLRIISTRELSAGVYIILMHDQSGRKQYHTRFCMPR
ncbi:MAG: hypothetical protein GF350_13120 [Chitinivibrionales bacterium]|nr:hypothetical protein [Chitinivibrionales bacterium]